MFKYRGLGDKLAHLAKMDVALIFRGYVDICSLYAIKCPVAHAAVPTHMIVLPIKELSNIDIPSNKEPKKDQI